MMSFGQGGRLMMEVVAKVIAAIRDVLLGIQDVLVPHVVTEASGHDLLTRVRPAERHVLAILGLPLFQFLVRPISVMRIRAELLQHLREIEGWECLADVIVFWTA